MQQKYWWKLRKGMGLKVQIPNDIDKETGKQKYRPAIVIKSYPSHVKVQLMTTEASSHDYFKIKIDDQIQYIRPIYYRTIPIEWVNQKWIDINKNIVKLDKKSILFIKIQEMEIKENLEFNIDLINYRNTIVQLKKEIILRTSPHMYLWRKQWNWMSSIILFKLKNNVLHI